MNTHELLSFISPQAEALQLSFFALLTAMFIGAIISTHLNATDASWEKSWNNGTSDDLSDDLDIDHGSVTDLWHAVATKSEKLAEIMPGMLLVVGLLGTFLGLGLALNHASNILGQSPALGANDAANNLQDLMGMMQGLGTKFKTSTWGITFFLLLKVWSSWLGFDEKRLVWVIRKVKAELEQRKAQEQEAELKKQQTLFTQINQAAGQIVHGFTQNLEKLSESQKALHQQSLQLLGKGMQAIYGDLANIKAATQASSEAMANFVNSTQTILKDMSVASNKMADGAHEVGIAGGSLVKAVDEFSTQFKQVLGDVQANLSSAIHDMSEQAAQTMEQGTMELGNATREISAALGVLSKDVNTTMNGVKDSIEKSLKIQQEGAVQFRCSSDTLNENVTATTAFVQRLGEDIRSGLQAVSDSGRRMTSIGKSLESIGTQMMDLAPALEPLKTLHAQHQPLLDEAKALRTDFLRLDSRQKLQFEKALIIQAELVQKLGDDILSGLNTASGPGSRIASQ